MRSMVEMTQADAVLAALSAGGSGARFNPVQIQILQFLFDRRVEQAGGASRFHFQPCYAGPYAHAIYEILQRFATSGEVMIDDSGPYRTYSVSEAGRRCGASVLERMPQSASKGAAKAARWVLSQRYWDMIFAIEREFPEMVTRSRAPAGYLGRREGTEVRRMHPLLAGMASVLGIRRRLDDFVPAGDAAEQDAIAIASDWRAVGDDLRFGFERVSPLRGSCPGRGRPPGTKL